MKFDKWFKHNHNTLIDLFCDFIKEEKVYDVTLDQFTRFMYTQTKHNIIKPNNKIIGRA